jgi:chitodextrinase
MAASQRFGTAAASAASSALTSLNGAFGHEAPAPSIRPPQKKRRLPQQEAVSFNGRKVRKHFPGYGWYAGVVISTFDDSGFCIRYADGDTEDVNLVELRQILC